MAGPAKTTKRVSELHVDELLDLIGSNSISPGAGVAGAVALALAAACARKAVTISLKHHPDSAEFLAARANLKLIASIALDDGERDSEAFFAFLHDKSQPAVNRLICEAEQFAELLAMFTATIDGIDSKIQANMAGDLFAARALAAAARQIEEHNKSEASNSLPVRRLSSVFHTDELGRLDRGVDPNSARAYFALRG